MQSFFSLPFPAAYTSSSSSSRIYFLYSSLPCLHCPIITHCLFFLFKVPLNSLLSLMLIPFLPPFLFPHTTFSLLPIPYIPLASISSSFSLFPIPCIPFLSHMHHFHPPLRNSQPSLSPGLQHPSLYRFFFISFPASAQPPFRTLMHPLIPPSYYSYPSLSLLLLTPSFPFLLLPFMINGFPHSFLSSLLFILSSPLLLSTLSKS